MEQHEPVMERREAVMKQCEPGRERYELAMKWVREAGDMLRRMRKSSLDIAEKSGHQDIVTRCDREIERFLRQRIWNLFPDDRIVGEEYTAAEFRSDRVKEQYAAELRSDQVKEQYAAAVWFLDPIDGTTNFVNQSCDYAVSVGCIAGGGPQFGIVLDVEGGRLYSAKEGGGAWMNGCRLHTAENQQVKDMLLTTPCVTELFLGSYREKEGISRLAMDVRAVRSTGSIALELCHVASGRADLCIALKSSPWDHNAARLILAEAGGAIQSLEGGELPYYGDSAFVAAGSEEAVKKIKKEYLEHL
ncbi:MAG: inositol monophosphatase family protein [Lachnospiraceae bacterium]|nr:inositol monophosphatase family protein [Lachnospiraceae bacterium]